jgi:hypothetical protein
MPFLPATKDEATAIEQLYDTSVSDRAVAIIAATLLEDRLTRTLKARFNENKKITDELFKVSGPLGYFGTKINVGFLVGLYGEPFRRELETIKDIRNAFAHSLQVRDFKTDKIRGLINNLKILEQYVEGPAPGGFTGTKFTLAELGGRPITLFKADREASLARPRERFIMATAVLSHLLASLNESPIRLGGALL